MYSLFCEAKFWTFKDDIQIKNTDLGVLRYHDKKELDECPYLEGKRSFCDQRGTSFVLKNKRPLKLRDKLKELEQQLSSNKIVFQDVKEDNVLHLMLNTGLLIAIGMNVHSKDISKIMFDKFLMGKLLSENISDVLFTKTHLVISYNENQLTLVNFSKPVTKFSPPEKLTKLEPKIHHVDLCGPPGRRLDRKLSCNKSGDSLLTWWHSSRNEVYPWSPLVKDEDRANVHVYCLTGTKIELVCFYRSEFDLMSVGFSQIKPNMIWVIEQKVSKKGSMAVEYSSHEVVKRSMKKVSVTSIALQTQICCHGISPDEEKLVLGCIDGSLILFEESRGITRLVKSAFIPNIVSWHNDGALIVVASERSQFQFFDLALSCIKIQFLSDDMNPANLLDLASCFKAQPILQRMNWNKKAKTTFYVDRFVPADHLLIFAFEGGPLGVLSLIGGGGLTNDVQGSGLTPDTLICQYLLWNQSDRALNLFLSLNWNTSGSACLAGLYHIANHVFRHPFTPEGEEQLEAALGSFYAPIRPLSRHTENEFGNQVHDLTRRFFHFLLRYRFYEKAYCLAIDLSNPDLFVDLYHCARVLEDEEMALACRTKIEELTCNSDSYYHSSCSRSSCSCSESNTEGEEDGILPPLPQVSIKKSKASRVPPLPDLNRQNKLRSSAFFNSNPNYRQPELAPANGFDSEVASTSFNGFYPSLLYPVPRVIDYNYPTTQILTPEFPHSYEIRTSFSGQESSLNSFASSDPSFRAQRSPTSFPLRGNVIESLYDLPSDLGLPIADEPKEFPSNPSVNTFGPLKLKSPRNQLQQGAASFCPSAGSFDHQLASPSLVRSGLRPNFNPQHHLHRNVAPRPSLPPPKHLNNAMLQRPLHFVPNAFFGQILRPMTPAGAKQKVKFSDTVTQIMVPDLSTISIEDETLMSQQKSRGGRPARTHNASTGANSSPQQRIGYSSGGGSSGSSSRECGGQPEEEENNGSIKVIHFGVV